MLEQLGRSVFLNRGRSFQFSITFLFLVVILAAITSHAQSNAYTLLPNQQLRVASGIIHHHSLAGPFLHHYYGESGIPYWKFSGSTVITDSYIRLTTQNAGEIGHMWNKEPIDIDTFEIIVGFRVFSSSKERRHLADGFALWITKEEAGNSGPILGHSMAFVGVGILFDEFDNNGRADNPTVGVLYNRDEERNRNYSPDRDFYGEYKSSCVFDYTKISNSDIATARIRYERGRLQVFLALNEKSEQPCIDLSNIKLNIPQDSYFLGLTAQTGGESCNHDIVFLHFSPLAGIHYDSKIYKPSEEMEDLYLDEDEYVPARKPPPPPQRPPVHQQPVPQQQQPPVQQQPVPQQQQPPVYQQPVPQQQQPPVQQQPVPQQQQPPVYQQPVPQQQQPPVQQQ